ncbi:YihY/virulence factor BrkB family protein [Microbacterium sp. LRZ72]|uniref:YihY/virulence factor BrkB family protein n=1 Tax=Microbacterium sp. LRZ72 TaxID=2942481 RepID=UPI0029B575D7|nr:YihY/virulence factor BrkB family protein [Microbacterium sp. LRZ72]MDX2376962.1 YihY/virulence factor BrkB family protein [Microbacterium sp. LRZ72]
MSSSGGPLPGQEAAEADARNRWELAQESLRERFEEPVERATRITRRTLAWFPIRVWRHFLRHNGFLLAAGVSYQSLFAIFGVLYLTFVSVGLWLGASTAAIDTLIDVINGYIPNLIGDGGLVTEDQVEAVAADSVGTLGVTGAIALVIVVWTAIGFITFARRAVRDIFGLPFDTRAYVLLKARDLLAAVLFGAALLLGAAVGSIATWALDSVFAIFGVELAGGVSQNIVRVSSPLVAFAINAAALAGMFRFLSGAALSWRRIWPGSLLGGAAIVVLQLGAGLLLSYTPSNPLLTTFAVLIGFLLWFRLNGIVVLVAGAWIAVAATDRDLALAHVSEEERLREEHRALLVAARIRLRDERQALAAAPWYRRWVAARRVTEAEERLARVEAAAPPEPRVRGFLD